MYMLVNFNQLLSIKKYFILRSLSQPQTTGFELNFANVNVKNENKGILHGKKKLWNITLLSFYLFEHTMKPICILSGMPEENTICIFPQVARFYFI